MENADQKKAIRVLIVDDESLARKRIRDLLSKQDDFEVIGECESGEEAVEAINSEITDLVFLDIQMQDMDGFSVLEKAQPQDLPAIIFVTAYDQYALKAFEVHAIDYLLKPFDDERFDETLEYVSRKIKKDSIRDLGKKITSLLADLSDSEENKTKPQSIAADSEFQKRLVIKSTGKITFVEVDEIEWISAEGSYVGLNTRGKSHLMRGTLKKLEATLDPKKFVRIHRSTIVNLSFIKELKSHFHGEFVVILKNGERLKLSRSYRENAELILNGNL